MSARYEFVPISDSHLFTISEHFGIVPSETKTQNIRTGRKSKRTSRGIKIIEVLNGFKPRSLFKGTASGYELILEMFILNIKKVHHQIRNHIRYLNRKNGKQGRSPRYERFFENFWTIFLCRPKIKNTELSSVVYKSQKK